jgi:dTDP-4-amino-4,6-dideoxygalactose transaminase
MKVPFLDLTRLDGRLEADLTAAFSRVLSSGRFILGPEVAAFEAACAELIGVRHAVGVSSCTDALLVSLLAMGIGPGDEVVCPSFTFFATVESVIRTGATPVFADVELDDYCISARTVEPTLTDRTRAVVAVHLFGQCADLEGIRACAGSRPLGLVEDAAQAFGARTESFRAGAAGDAGCFSFFPSKNLGGFGDGGLVTSNHDSLAERVRMLRSHGSARKHHHELVGGNFRLDSLQAALLGVKLGHLTPAIAARRAHANTYTQRLLEEGVAAPSTRSLGSEAPILVPTIVRGAHVFNQYVVRVPGPGRRDRLQTYLASKGVDTEVYYPVPAHLQPCVASLGCSVGELPATELAASEVLALPLFPELRVEELEYVVEHVVAFGRGDV